MGILAERRPQQNCGVLCHQLLRAGEHSVAQALREGIEAGRGVAGREEDEGRRMVGDSTEKQVEREPL